MANSNEPTDEELCIAQKVFLNMMQGRRLAEQRAAWEPIGEDTKELIRNVEEDLGQGSTTGTSTEGRSIQNKKKRKGAHTSMSTEGRNAGNVVSALAKGVSELSMDTVLDKLLEQKKEMEEANRRWEAENQHILKMIEDRAKSEARYIALCDDIAVKTIEKNKASGLTADGKPKQKVGRKPKYSTPEERYEAQRNRSADVCYHCDLCDKTIQLYSKYSHVKSKAHLDRVAKNATAEQ